MRKLAAIVVTALVVALSVVASAPPAAFAATSAAYTDEAAGTSATARSVAQGWGTAWRTSAQAAGGVVESISITNPHTPTYVYNAGSPTTSTLVGNPLFTASDGTTVTATRTQYTNAASPAYVGVSASQAVVSCNDNGAGLQDSSPRPTSLVDTTGCPNGAPGGKGFGWSILGGSGVDTTTRDALEVTFSKPVLAFGAWFGDLETRTDGGGTPAFIRLYGATGNLLSEQTIVPSTVQAGAQTSPAQSTCGLVPAVAFCGNATTRWVGFVADPTQPVAKMVVIVGDDGPGGGVDEGLSFIGAMVATRPALTLTKALVAGYPQSVGAGAYDIKYTLTGTNTGKAPLAAIDLVDDLGATFSPVPAASIVVQSVAVTGATVTANPAYNGTTDTHVLTSASSTLAAGATFTATILVRVSPGAVFTTFSNSAVLKGTSGTTTVSDAPDAPVDVVLSGTLVILKTVAGGPAAGAAGDFGFAVDCGAAGSYIAAVSAEVRDGGNGGVTLAVPAGVDCTVSETSLAVAPPFYAWDGSSVTPDDVTVGSDETAQVGVVNTLRPLAGTLRITKKIVGGPAGGTTGDFAFTVDCGAAGTFAATVSVVASDTGSTDVAIPVTEIATPSSCVVTESPSLPEPPAFFDWSGTTGSPATAIVADGGTDAVTVTNMLEPLTGTLTVTKQVVGAPGDEFTGAFDFSVDCGAVGEFDTSIELVSEASGESTLTIPVSSAAAPTDCTVAETARAATPPFFEWVGDLPDPTTVSVSSTGPANVTVTNTLAPLTGSLTITKTVTGSPSAGVTGTFAFRADCAAAGTFETTVVLADESSGSATISGIPSPATCVVTEGTLPTPPQFFAWDGTTIAPTSVAVTTAGVAGVTVTNALRPLSALVTVSKNVVGGPAAGITADFEFELDCGPTVGVLPVTVSLGGAASGSTAVSVPVVSASMPTACELTELTPLPAPPAYYTWTGRTGSGVTVTVGDGDAKSATVVNTLAPLTGSLVITKTVVGAPDQKFTGTFDFAVDCGAAGTFDAFVELTAEVSGTAIVTIPVASAAAPTECSVAETGRASAPTYFAWNAPLPAPSPVMITSTEGAAITVTNTLRPLLGSLVVTKTVENGPAGGVTGSFDFDIDCGAAGQFSALVDLANSTSGSALVESIPAPATCTITEAALPAAPSGYYWTGSPVVSPATTSIVDGVRSEASVTNTLTQQLGTLTLVLTVADAPPGGITGTFVLSVSCGSSGIFTLNLDFDHSASATGSVGNIPVPTVCIVTEVSRPAPPPGYVWTSLVLPPVTAAVASAPVVLTEVTALVPQSAIALTGTNFVPIVIVVVALLAGGGTLLVISRRRRSRS